MIAKRLIAFIYTINQLHWNHLMFRFSLQHCFKDCERNIKLTSKPSAHQHFISFALISRHTGKLSSCLSKYMDIWDLKHARICDILSAAKKNSCAHYLVKPYPSLQQRNYLSWETEIMGLILINADPTSCKEFDFNT